jgi:phospholipid/cholesterol/gamma-HCH transport system substrate-binding protein
MSERSQQALVGLVFVVSVVVLIAGVLWFKNYHFGQQNVLVTVDFPSTSGLVKGDLVEVQGVTSGEVAAIDYQDSRSLVKLKLDREVKLYRGSRFVIENVGIMGQKMVAIYPGPADTPLPPETTEFHGEYQPGIPQLISELGGTLEAFGRIAERLDAIMAAMGPTDSTSIHKTLSDANTITSEMAIFLRESRGDLSESIRNLNVSMAELRKVLDGRGDEISGLLHDAKRASAQLDTTLSGVDAAADRLTSVLERLEAGEGTLGKAMSDDSLYDELTRTLSETRALVTDIRAHPKKYVKLSLF